MSLKKIAGVQEIARRAFNSLAIQRKEIQSANDQTLALGIKNYNAIIPRNAQEGKFGFFRQSTQDNKTDHFNAWFHYKPSLKDKIARVYIQDDNQMHNTPTMRKGYKWVVQFGRSGVHRLPVMGWTYANDPIAQLLLKFDTLEEALYHCQELGVGYQVQYPRFRYPVRKTYADNFKWKGFPKDNDPDQ